MSVRILAVHAHPDDESIWTGGLIAHATQRGAEVRVLTCTLGELGEAIGPDVHGLEMTGLLGGYRYHELHRALVAFGVHGPAHAPRLLGGTANYHDSGMAGDSDLTHPIAPYLAAHVAAATRDIAAELREFRPHLVVTYGPDGGYGHPDHVAAHRATHRAIASLGGVLGLPGLAHQPDGKPSTSADVADGTVRTEDGAPATGARGDATSAPIAGTHTDVLALAEAAAAQNQQPERPFAVLWAVTDRDALAAGLNAIVEAPEGWLPAGLDDLATVPTGAVDWELALSDAELTTKIAAMRAHATQIWIADGQPTEGLTESGEFVTAQAQWTTDIAGVFALSNLLTQPILRTEHYIIGDGRADESGALVAQVDHANYPSSVDPALWKPENAVLLGE